jgi:hypothetical protein
MEIIIRNDMGVTSFTTPAAFDAFRNLVATGQNIYAIKYMREKEPHWGLKECKDFVEACVFPPQATADARAKKALDPDRWDAPALADALRDIKFDLRETIAQDYAVSRDRLLDIYDKIVGLVK